MQTYEQELTPDSWVEILGGADNIYFDITTGSDHVLLTFTESVDAPALDAPAVPVRSWPHGHDFAGGGYGAGQFIWARSASSVFDIVVVR